MGTGKFHIESAEAVGVAGADEARKAVLALAERCRTLEGENAKLSAEVAALKSGQDHITMHDGDVYWPKDINDFLTGFGCITGDCPHISVLECHKAVYDYCIEEFESKHTQSKQAEEESK